MKQLKIFAATLLALLALGACADFARLVTPAGNADNTRPAHIAFTTSVTTATQLTIADVVMLRVRASYVVNGGGRTSIGSQTISLTSAASQAVPIPVDLASCLADASRDQSEAATGCPVVLELALLVNNVVVDNQIIGPLRLSPGATTSLSEPVALFEIATIEIDTPTTFALITGETRSLTSNVRDSRGATVSGRAVSWSSDAPAVATVNDAGMVTALSVGNAQVTATLGTVTQSVTVNVNRPPVALTVIAPLGGSGTGLIESTPAGIRCRVMGTAVSGTCRFAFAADAEVLLRSVADAGQAFGMWGGSCVGQAVGAQCTVTMGAAQSVSAAFLAPRVVTIQARNTDGNGRIVGNAGLDCRIAGSATSGVCTTTVPEGTTISMVSQADGATASTVAQAFAGWGGACAGSADTTCALVATTGELQLTAGFYGGRTLTISTAGDGGGSVAGGVIACSRVNNTTNGTCTTTVRHASTVVVSAVADAQSLFAGWTGACSGLSTTCSVTLAESQAATATFRPRMVPLTVNMSGAGNGLTFVNGAVACRREISDPALVSCVKEYPTGTVVTITSTAGELTRVTGISGDCNGLSACVLTMNAPRTVTALFTLTPPVTLIIEGIANGSGVVRSGETVPLIDCPIRDGVASGPRCSATVPVGTELTLTAVGNVGNALRFWNGRCANTATAVCSIVMNSTSNAIVGFTPAIDVEMQLSGVGGGSVAFQPVGAPSQLPCALPTASAPVSCRFALPAGLSGVFRAQSSTGSLFQGFVGPCAESVSGAAVPVCTYRGVGFLRIFTGTFARLP